MRTSGDGRDTVPMKTDFAINQTVRYQGALVQVCGLNGGDVQILDSNGGTLWVQPEDLDVDAPPPSAPRQQANGVPPDYLAPAPDPEPSGADFEVIFERVLELLQTQDAARTESRARDLAAYERYVSAVERLAGAAEKLVAGRFAAQQL